MKKIKSTEEFYSIIEQENISLIYFYTNWCPDCFMAKPYLPRLEKDFQDIEFYKINRDKHIELSKHLHVFGIPSFILFKDGEELGSFISKSRKSYIEVYNFISNTVGSD